MIEGVLYQSQLPDGRIVVITPLTLGRARICVGFDEYTYDDAW